MTQKLGGALSEASPKVSVDGDDDARCCRTTLVRRREERWDLYGSAHNSGASYSVHHERLVAIRCICQTGTGTLKI